MTYTILFTDNEHRTAAILVLHYEKGDTSIAIVRHAHCKTTAYFKAYMLGPNDFAEYPFYVRRAGEKGQEVEFALAVLQERLEGVRAKGGLAFGRRSYAEELGPKTLTPSITQ